MADQGETGLEDTGVFKSLDLAAQGEGELVFVVDDLADMELIVVSPKKKNYRVAMAPNGKRGLEVARELQPSLIITDWMMPQMSGPELLEAAKKDALLQSVLIILLTAKSDEESKLIGTEIGADAFLGKGAFNDQELGSLVRNLLSLRLREREVEALNHQLTGGCPKTVSAAGSGGPNYCWGRGVGPRAAESGTRRFYSVTCRALPRSAVSCGPKLARVLNEYLEVMNDVIFEHGGTIDKFIGDAIMVIFGAPKPLVAPEQAEKSVACARAMQEAMVGLNQKWQEDGIPELKMRIGIHHGPSVVGPSGRRSARIIPRSAPTVNLASRIESVCVPGQVFVSGELCDFLPENAAEEAGEFDLKGIAGEVTLYRVV